MAGCIDKKKVLIKKIDRINDTKNEIVCVQLTSATKIIKLPSLQIQSMAQVDFQCQSQGSGNNNSSFWLDNHMQFAGNFGFCLTQ